MLRLNHDSWAGVFCVSLQVSGEQFFADVAKDILLYVSRDLSDKVNYLCVSLHVFEEQEPYNVGTIGEALCVCVHWYILQREGWDPTDKYHLKTFALHEGLTLFFLLINEATAASGAHN